MKNFLLLFLLLPHLAMGEESKKVINWLNTGFPPLHIDDGTHEKGFGDVIQEELIKCLPMFKHRIERHTPIKRLVSRLYDTTSNNCAPGHAIEKGRFIEVNLSDTLLYVDSPVALIRADKLKLIRKKHKVFSGEIVALEDLLTKTKLRAGSIGGSFHGNKIDYLQQKFKSKFTFSPANNEMAQVKMLMKNRVDYIIGYSFSYNYHLSRLSGVKDFVYLRLKEKVDYTAGRSLCSNGPQGKKIIGLINDCIKSPKFKKKAFDSYLKYAPKSLKKDIIEHNLKNLK